VIRLPALSANVLVDAGGMVVVVVGGVTGPLPEPDDAEVEPEPDDPELDPDPADPEAPEPDEPDEPEPDEAEPDAPEPDELEPDEPEPDDDPLPVPSFGEPPEPFGEASEEPGPEEPEPSSVDPAEVGSVPAVEAVVPPVRMRPPVEPPPEVMAPPRSAPANWSSAACLEMGATLTPLTRAPTMFTASIDTVIAATVAAHQLDTTTLRLRRMPHHRSSTPVVALSDT
jgi:hypothetical protein